MGGVAVLVPSSDPVFTTLVGVAMDVTLCNGNGYWTRGVNNSQITMPGRVLLYHEVVGHALHHCNGTFNAGDPEGQAIAEENVLRGVIGEPTRTAHEGGCGGGGGGDCLDDVVVVCKDGRFGGDDGPLPRIEAERAIERSGPGRDANPGRLLSRAAAAAPARRSRSAALKPATGCRGRR